MPDVLYRGGSAQTHQTTSGSTPTVAAGVTSHVAGSLQVVLVALSTSSSDLGRAVTATPVGGGNAFSLLERKFHLQGFDSSTTWVFQRVLTGTEPVGSNPTVSLSHNSPGSEIMSILSVIYTDAVPIATAPTWRVLSTASDTDGLIDIDTTPIRSRRPGSRPLHFGVHRDSSAGVFEQLSWLNATARQTALSVSIQNTSVADDPLLGAGATSPVSYFRVTGDTNSRFVTVGTMLLEPANSPPSSPILLTSGSLNRALPNVIDWEHVDPDGDGQSAARVFDRVVGDPTFTQIDVPGPNSRYEAPALSLALGQHEYQVQTADTSGAWGTRSSSGFFLVANPPAGPAITAPVNGSTVGTPQVTVTWTGTGTSWELRSVAEVDGVADTGTVYYASGEQQVSSVGRLWVVPLPVNSRRERIQVREKASGLFGDWSDVGIQVSYTLPGVVPASVAVATTELVVTAGSPVLTGGEPAISYLELERGLILADGSITAEGFLRALDQPGRVRLQVPSRGSHRDGTPRSGVAYAYRWHAVGQNGTRSIGAWATGPVDFGGTVDDPFEPTFMETF